MKLLIVVRHGWAGDPIKFAAANFGLSDDKRPLDKRGRREMRQVAKALKFYFKQCTYMAASPLVRAQETAEILRKRVPASKRPKLSTMAELRPEVEPEVTWNALQKMKSHDVVMIVGHEPHLSKFLSFMLTGDCLHPLPLKKGGVAMIEIKSAHQKELKCFTQPSLLIKARKK